MCFTVVVTVLICLILWQMWDSRAAFGIFAPPVIIALLCFIFASLRFAYSCFTLKNACEIYTKIIAKTKKYMWLDQATAHDIHENTVYQPHVRVHAMRNNVRVASKAANSVATDAVSTVYRTLTNPFTFGFYAYCLPSFSTQFGFFYFSVSRFGNLKP